jgi:hypothetical protein
LTRRQKSAGPRGPGSGCLFSNDASGRASIEARLARLAETPTRDLRAEWRRQYRAEPPSKLSRDLLIRALAYKIQEQASGGPDAALTRRLRRLAEQLAAGADISRGAGTTLKTGARLVREWRGQAHTITVLENGFEYEGRRFRSLSQIAKAITGVHWSGPRFFGLVRGSVRARGSDIAPRDNGTAQEG